MTATSATIQEIKIAHSPDSDDAFMFYGLATNKVRVPGYKFTHTLTDIETLNQRAIHDPYYDVTAISFHAYPYMQDTYTLMACGGSVGEGYGPMVVSPRKLSHADLKKTRIAVPGTLTTAYLTLKLFCRRLRPSPCPSTRSSPQSLRASSTPASSSTRASSPTATTAWSRRSTSASGGASRPASRCPWAATPSAAPLGKDAMRITTNALRDSIQHALDNREQALAYAMQFARDLDPALADKFVGMYVNERTLNYGEDGREAIRKLLEMGFDRGIIPVKAKVDFVD